MLKSAIKLNIESISIIFDIIMDTHAHDLAYFIEESYQTPEIKFCCEEDMFQNV